MVKAVKAPAALFAFCVVLCVVTNIAELNLPLAP